MLAKAIAAWIAGAASIGTYPFIAFVIGAAVNMFVPSGGGQWAVQGPIMMGAAQELGADLARTALGLLPMEQGTVELLGIDLQRMRPKELRASVAGCRSSSRTPTPT